MTVRRSLAQNHAPEAAHLTSPVLQLGLVEDAEVGQSGGDGEGLVLCANHLNDAVGADVLVGRAASQPKVGVCPFDEAGRFQQALVVQHAIERLPHGVVGSPDVLFDLVLPEVETIGGLRRVVHVLDAGQARVEVLGGGNVVTVSVAALVRHDEVHESRERGRSLLRGANEYGFEFEPKEISGQEESHPFTAFQ